MDENVIQKVKCLYRHKLIHHIISQGVDKKLTELNLKDVLFSLACTWSSVSPIPIELSWKKLWPMMNASSKETEEWDAEDNLPIADWLQKEDSR